VNKRTILAVLTVLALLGAGCGFLRNLDTPKSRLLGHWVTNKGANLYFGPLVNDQGALIVVPEKGERQNYLYRVISQDLETDEVTVDVTAEGQPAEERVYRIPEDGIFMREQTEPLPDEEKTEYIYADTDSQPSPYVQTVAAEAVQK